MLEIKEVSKSFTGNEVLQNFSMSLEKGKIYVLFGTNGAGKTTLLNIINGQIQNDTGVMVFKNKDISKLSMSERASLGILRLWQHGKVFKNMTVLDNLLVSVDSLGENLLNYVFRFSKIRKQNKANLKKANEVMEILEITSMSNKLAKELSFGQQRLLSFGRIMMNPILEEGKALILADEPFAGIHEGLIKKISNLLDDFSKLGNTVLMIEHNIDEAIHFSDYILLMQEGRLYNQFEKQNLSKDNLKEIYAILT